MFIGSIYGSRDGFHLGEKKVEKRREGGHRFQGADFRKLRVGVYLPSTLFKSIGEPGEEFYRRSAIPVELSLDEKWRLPKFPDRVAQKSTRVAREVPFVCQQFRNTTTRFWRRGVTQNLDTKDPPGKDSK